MKSVWSCYVMYSFHCARCAQCTLRLSVKFRCQWNVGEYALDLQALQPLVPLCFFLVQCQLPDGCLQWFCWLPLVSFSEQVLSFLVDIVSSKESIVIQTFVHIHHCRVSGPAEGSVQWELCSHFDRSRQGVFTTDGWWIMALVAFLGSFNHFLMYLVMVSSKAEMVDARVWLTMRWKQVEGIR